MMIMLNTQIALSSPLPRLNFAKSWHIWSQGLNPRHANHSRLWMLIAWKGSRSKGTPFKEGSCKSNVQWVHRTPPEWKYHQKSWFWYSTDVELEQDETGARSNKLVIPLKKRSTQQKYCKSSELQFEIHMKNICCVAFSLLVKKVKKG